MRCITPSLCLTSVSGFLLTFESIFATVLLGSEKSENIWLKLALHARSRFKRSVLGPESVVSCGFTIPES